MPLRSERLTTPLAATSELLRFGVAELSPLAHSQRQGLSFSSNNVFEELTSIPLRSGLLSLLRLNDFFCKIHYLLVSSAFHEESVPNTFLGFFYFFFFQVWSLPLLVIAVEAVKGRSTSGGCNLSRTKKRPRIQHPSLLLPGKQLELSAGWRDTWV